MDCTVKIWKNSVEGKHGTIKAHVLPVRSVVFSNDGTLLLTASDDKTLKVFRTEDRKFLYSFIGHSNWVRKGVFSPDLRMVASASDDKTVKVWDLQSTSCIHT